MLVRAARWVNRAVRGWSGREDMVYELVWVGVSFVVLEWIDG